jgi:hypothetical protein
MENNQFEGSQFERELNACLREEKRSWQLKDFMR